MKPSCKMTSPSSPCIGGQVCCTERETPSKASMTKSYFPTKGYLPLSRVGFICNHKISNVSFSALTGPASSFLFFSKKAVRGSICRALTHV